jgi:hypothetical protein
LAQDGNGARRNSSFRFVNLGGYFLLWGFLGHVTEFYGSPEEPLPDPPEYDLVYFDLSDRVWKNQLPFEKETEWSRQLPALHMCASYQGITTGSHRPQLKIREGVLRPDLNITFDQVTYDSKRHRMVYFTGGRTLAYDLADRAWSDIAPLRGPPPVTGGSLLYLPERDEILLFGGGHIAEFAPNGKLRGYTGTWVYDCESSKWQELERDVEPPPRMSTRLVLDTGSKLAIVFGGDMQSHYLADTWIFDSRSRRWRKSLSAQSPPARAGHFTVYDRGSGWVIVGGGYNTQDLEDMWAFDASRDRWFKLKGTVPSGWHITADIDPSRSLILLTTASKPEADSMTCNEIYSVRTTYGFRIDARDLIDSDHSPTVQVSAPKRDIESAVVGTRPDPLRRRAQQDRLRAMPPNRWILLENPGRPAPIRSWGSASFDSHSGRIVYWGGGHCGYGGNDYDFYDVGENTWMSLPTFPEYPERAWDKGVNPAGVTFAGAPWIRHGRKVYAYDPLSRKIINTKAVYLTAGYEPEALATVEPRTPNLGHGEEFIRSSYTKWTTWAFDVDLGDWELLCSGHPGLDLTVTTPHGVMAVDYDWRNLDPGNSTRETPFDQLPQKENAVYLLDVANRRWQKLNDSGPWPQNLYEMTALAFDTKRDRLVLHGGGPRRDELWSFPLSERRWQILNSSGDSPDTQPPVSRREGVYLPLQDVYLTSGQPLGSGAPPSVYAYHFEKNCWYRTGISAPQGRETASLAGQNRALAYDTQRDLVYMVLGKRRDGDVGEVEVYALRYDHSTATEP